MKQKRIEKKTRRKKIRKNFNELKKNTVSVGKLSSKVLYSACLSHYCLLYKKLEWINSYTAPCNPCRNPSSHTCTHPIPCTIKSTNWKSKFGCYKKNDQMWFYSLFSVHPIPFEIVKSYTDMPSKRAVFTRQLKNKMSPLKGPLELFQHLVPFSRYTPSKFDDVWSNS